MAVFVAIVDEGSMSAAGRRMGLPLATVSRKLAELEAHVHTRLITRSTRRLVLTDAGQDYLAACRQILEQVDEAERTAAGAYADVKGQLVIAAPVLFGRLHVVPVVAAFLEQHPDVDVQLQLHDRNASLIDEHVDVALRIGSLPDSSMVALQVGVTRQVVCASPDYLARFGVPRALGDLSGHRCISFAGMTGSTHWTFGEPGAAQGVPIRPRLTTSTADAAIAAALLGLGLTRVLLYQAAEALHDGRLVRLLRAYESPDVPASLVHVGGGRLPMKTRAFIDFAAHALRKRLEAPDTRIDSFVAAKVGIDGGTDR